MSMVDLRWLAIQSESRNHFPHGLWNSYKGKDSHALPNAHIGTPNYVDY